MSYRYKLSADAKEDLFRIYQYGYKTFGEKRADDYYSSLYDAFDKIVKNPYIYQSVDHERYGYRRYTLLPDDIYYRVNGKIIEIMAVIGKQDINIWL